MEHTDVRKDPIVEEVRQVREAHAEEFGYDLKAIVCDLRKHERQGGRKVVSFPPKLIKQDEDSV